MTWSSHIYYIANKLSRICGIIFRLKHHVPVYILKIIYNLLFLSHLNYRITAWGSNVGPRINTLPKKAIKALSNSKHNSHATPLFKNLELLKADNIYKLSCFKLFYKYKNGKIPDYFKNMFPTQDNTMRSRRTRWVLNASVTWKITSQITILVTFK